MVPRNEAFEPVQLEFRFESGAEEPESRNLVQQMLALNERLLCTHLEDLRSDSAARRKKAARGLANLGEIGRRAIPALRAALDDRDRKVREAAAFALEQLDSAEMGG